MRNLRHVVVTAVILAMLLLGSAVAPAGAAGPYDAFAQPRPVPGGSSGATYTGNNNAATRQPPCEPRHAANNSGGRSVWLKLGARASRSFVRVNTAGSSFDTLLAVYRGSNLCSLTRVVQNDDCRGIGSSCVAFTAQANTTYRIAIDGFDGESGAYQVRFTRGNI